MQDDLGKQPNKKADKDSESGSLTAPFVIATVFTPIRKFFQPKPKVIGSFIKTDKWKALGRGCYGEVFCVDEWMDTNGNKRGSIALKKANPQPGAEDRLQKEMKSLSKLNHLFVVKYLGLAKMEDKNGQSIAIAMELCEGDLKTYVLEGLPNIPKGSLNNRVLLGQVVLGLAYIHGLGIIHKDLKPDNILLWKSPSGLVLGKLGDFGFSKGLRNRDQTEHSDTTHFGSWGYMAPELLMAVSSETKQSVKCSYATDAYSLGIVISFTANEGKHPFGQNKFKRDFLMSEGTAPTELDADWDLTDLVARLTYKDPKKRPRVDTVIYHPYFVLSNNKTRSNYIEKVYNFFESFASWTYSTNDIGSADDNKLKLGWYLDNFCHTSFGSPPGPIRNQTNNGTSTAAEELKTSTETLPSSVEKLTEQLHTAASLKPLFDFDKKNKEHLLSSLQAESNIMEKIKEKSEWTRSHIFSLLNSYAPVALSFYIWCLMYNMCNIAPQFLTLLTSTNDHYKRCFEMTEFEFTSLHFDDEQTIKEIWNLKYESEYCGEGDKDENPQPLFVYTASSLFPTFMWETLVRRFEKHINSTENGIKGRSLLNWVAFNEQPFDSTNESPEHFIRLILEKGGDANGADIFGLTPVHMAARNVGRNAFIILKVLLEEGRGDPNIRNKRIIDPILDMILPIVNIDKLKKSIIDKIKIGLASAQQPDITETKTTHTKRPRDPLAIFLDSEGNLHPRFQPMLRNLKIPLLLHPKVLEGFASILMSVLTEKSGSPVVQTVEGRTPVHCAAANESSNGPQLLEILLAHKGNPNLKDNAGFTPLHRAAANKSDLAPNMVEILLQGGGDPSIVNKNGKTPLDLAKCNKGKCGTKIVELLEENLKIYGPPVKKKVKLDSSLS